jgi:hypothetical protein
MDSQLNKQDAESDYNPESSLEHENATDATGYWFAAAVVFAFLAAGVIVYRTGNSDIRTASNDLPVAAQSGPIDPAPILQ